MTSHLTRRITLRFATLFLILCYVGNLRAEYAMEVSVCQLVKDPATYNHKLIEDTGFISHGFEDFGIYDLACHSYPYVWLEYRGETKSGTMYCCGATAGHTRTQALRVEDIVATQGRVIYEWAPFGKRASYMVVVNRPYWLSFLAEDANKVAWVLAAAYESSCDKNNSVKRIR
jgi:hypothetical protein